MYKRIMIVVNQGAVARSALNEGLAEAKVHGAEVLLFHVLPNYVVPVDVTLKVVHLSPERHRKAAERLASRILSAATADATALGLMSSVGVGSDIDPAACLAHAASERQCNLIVIGAHGRSAIQRLIFGSVVARLITLSPVPLLVCKEAPARRQPSKQRAEPDRPVSTAAALAT